MSEPDSLAVLQAENERLIALLEANGIEWRLAPEPTTSPPRTESSRLSTEAKVALFRRWFRGRTDVYPVRWESKTTGKSGYAPACANEWRAGVCEKPRIKCGDCRWLAKIPGATRKSLTVTLANLVYFEKAELSQPLANRLIRLAAFQNPEFYRAQAMRLSVWDKPRVIGCAENYPHHIALPRGCLDAAQDLLRENGIRCDLQGRAHRRRAD